MRLVVALGGNALLKRGEPLAAEVQKRNMQAAAGPLARACAAFQTTIVHGNGPQVGLLALEAHAYKAAPPAPLDVLGAESQGMIGYVIAQELRNADPGREVVALLTQTVVDPDDPAFQRPSKPIGPVYPAAEAESLRARGWSLAPDGDGVRRTVPSPAPIDIVELAAIESLLAAGAVVVCAGGGGVPVRRLAGDRLEGLEAVIDKDLTAALLAARLGAERLVILTDVDGVYLDWGTDDARRLGEITAAELRGHAFAAGSMGPKAAAARLFVERTGKTASIGALTDAEAVIAGRAGTLVRP
ncbi:carbamate kinase [Phenylobacterium sp.]|uniref:carbamate kinase n=1 Tax=Phenylobacterium sp. TaxID=1871053 RepID=UPI0035AFB31F